MTFEASFLDAAVAVSKHLDVSHTCSAVLEAVDRLFDASSSWILIHDAAKNELSTAAVRGPSAAPYKAIRIPAGDGLVGKAFTERRPVFVPDAQHEWRWFDAARVHRSGLRSVLIVPLQVDGDAVGVVGFDAARFTPERPPSGSEIERLGSIGALAASALRKARLLEGLDQDRTQLRRVIEQRQHLKLEVSKLRTQVCDAHQRAPVLGNSSVFRYVLTQLELVAPADSTVLLVGETGTGKELIARAIHEQSRRRGRPFVAVNCAALPETLVESELFGYEKGAFTGAVARKSGRFEQAHFGTLFLDEIGDLPGPAQAKLLRVLQEREVQRVGSVRPVPVDIRLIAATNQDLAAGMESRQFRPDLFYRLSVFPIRVPPLRERRGDIPLLAQHFVRRFAEQQHKPVPRLSDGVMERLIGYEWPGNIRELQNVIERAVILVNGPVVETDLIALHTVATTPAAAAVTAPAPVQAPPDNVIRFCDAERRAILRALEACGWRISGRGGAADMLGLKPTTMHAKMKKLGISRPSPSAERSLHAGARQ